MTVQPTPQESPREESRSEDYTGAIRRDVRLLGDALGQVLIEQEGESFLATEEHVRAAARQSREVGDPSIVREAVRALEPESQAKMLRAFALYFQLANAAEQHHRIRRRREDEHAGIVTRESLEEAFELLAGVPEEELHTRMAGISVELVLTAHPTEATRRTLLQAHVRIAEMLTELDDAMLTPREREAIEERLAEEITRDVADRRGARRAPARDRRDPPRALVLRGEPARRRRGALRHVPPPLPGRAAALLVRHVDRRRPRRQSGSRRRDDRGGARTRTRARAAALPA